MDDMAVITCRKNTHSILVTFSDDTSVRAAAKIKKGFLKLLNESVDRYRFDLSGIQETDFTFIQLLISYQYKLKSLNREMVLLNCSDDCAFIRTAVLCGIDIKRMFTFEGDNHEYGY